MNLQKTIFLIFILFKFTFSQVKNIFNSIICGGGTEDPPTLIEYENSIRKKEEFSPIRIFIDYTYLDECFKKSEFADIAKSKDLIKEKLREASYLMEQIINVQRYTSNLYLTEDLISLMKIHSYSNTLLIGIPFDLIIYPMVTGMTKKFIFAQEKYINFYGYPLVVDESKKRPIFGILRIYNLDYTTMENLDTYFVNAFIHQLIHIMVFDPNLISNFPNYNGPQYNYGIVIHSGVQI